jgi:ubiquinone/menaquinone biosynthesis C-methylase UbiE
MSEDYLDINRESWNARTELHFNSEFYDNPSFLEGRNSLNSIELDLLGDVSGKKILHLQCHFGQDTISLSRMGAKCTGIDLSDKAIEKARELTAEAGEDVRFIASDVYGLDKVLDEYFDIVFTSYGTIGWLPDLDKWAAIIHKFLKPGGSLVFAEFHPVVWMFNNDFSGIEYSYFNRQEIVEEKEESYSEGKLKQSVKEISWNHDLGEVFTALFNKNLRLEAFREFDYSPYPCFQDMIESEPGKFQIRKLTGKIPLVYALKAMKPI